ncbi:hypothetical protein DY000_02021794 [Brassica cretica]|uniref:Uncharacterized protein n=1 Tax=Brassica cretica TaxID=69181 RepID=A0ABQ7EDS3_BRACR|nr:hypothetical protein DY000_02021794 [Brassica cretica]
MAELDPPCDQPGHPPSWMDNRTSSADGRAGSSTRPARPSAELDQSSSADGRAGPNTMAGWPSWNDRAVTVPSLYLPPSGLDRTCCSFISIRVTVGTLRFKTAITLCLV